MSLTNQDLLAEAVRTIPAWRRFLQEKRAEQQALLAKMREQDATAQSAGEGRGVTSTVPLSLEEPDTLRWLRDESEEVSEAAPRGGTAEPLPRGSALAQRFAAVATSTRPSSVGATASAMADAAPSNEAIPDAAEEGRANPAPIIFGEIPGSAAQAELQQALTELPSGSLPWPVQVALEQEEPDAIAQAFVTAQERGDLPPRVAEAVETLREVDDRYAAAQEGMDTEGDTPSYGF